MKSIKIKIYQYIANQLHDMAKDSMDNQKMFDMIMTLGCRLDSICVEQEIYLD